MTCFGPALRCVAAVTLLGACHPSAPHPQARQEAASAILSVWWSPRLGLSSLDHLDRRLSEPIDAVTVRRYQSRRDLLLNRNAEVATIHDCKTYLDLRQQGFRSRSDMEERYLQSIGAECFALAALRDVSPAKSTHLSSFRLDEAAVGVLPPSCGVVVSEDELKKVRTAEAQGLSWHKYQPALQTRLEGANVLVVEGRTWEARLEIYARGDFDADAVEDLLLKVSGSMKEGTYQSTRLLMLSRTSDDAVLRVSREFPWS